MGWCNNNENSSPLFACNWLYSILQHLLNHKNTCTVHFLDISASKREMWMEFIQIIWPLKHFANRHCICKIRYLDIDHEINSFVIWVDYISNTIWPKCICLLNHLFWILTNHLIELLWMILVNLQYYIISQFILPSKCNVLK